MKIPAILAFILCAVVFCAGCSLLEERPAVSPVPTTGAMPQPGSTQEDIVSSAEPAAMALQVSDLPDGYIIRERADIPYADASQVAREQGWQKGYLASFYRMDADKYDVTAISQRIGVYHVDNVNLLDSRMKIVFEETENDLLSLANDTVAVTELPFPKTGDRTSAYRITISSNTYGVQRYVALFTKKDVIEAIEMWGTTTDYEGLKGIAARAAEKIP